LRKSLAMIAIAGLALGLAAPHVAFANNLRTDQFLWKCTLKDGKTPAEAQIGYAQCLGFIDGVLDMHAMMVAFSKSKPQFCLPAQGLSLDQAHKIFVKWANDNPRELHQLARTSVVIALKQAFPCKG
jgi:Rap1a immunity proteins